MKDTIKFVHYSASPFVFDRQQNYSISNLTFNKPGGLWFSVEGFMDDIHWKDWCIDQEFQVKNLACSSEILFSSSSDILWLKTFMEIKDFENEFIFEHPILRKEFEELSADLKKQIEEFHEEYEFINPKKPIFLESLKKINWEAVRKNWSGIIIAPFNRKMRDDSINYWYDAWDCSSGCVWNLQAVEKVIPRTQRASAPENE